MGYDLGVDLGTTFVAAAISRDGRAQMCTLGNQTVVTPAVVYLNDQSELVFGETAERRAVSHPDRVERGFKRRLGDPTPVVLGGVPYQVTALMAAQLRDVLDKVTAVEGSPPDQVALTFPANWGPYRRELFEEVPRLAGLRDHVSLTEPEAAAGYYGGSRDIGDGDTIAVYDLGGGTFDATVLRRRDGAVEMVGDPEGIERLGGIDFDEAILQWINHSYGGAVAELDLSDPEPAAAAAKLRQECVLAKEALSVDTETTIPVLLPNRHFFARLSRADFEAMIRAPVESTIGTLVRAVQRAGLAVDELAAVLLVGGSSRIPLIQRMIAEEIDRPTVVDAHPKYAVALGAAMVAARRDGAGIAGTAARVAVAGAAAPVVGAGAPKPDLSTGTEPDTDDPRDAPVPAAALGLGYQPPEVPDEPATSATRPRWLWAAVAAAAVALLMGVATAYIANRPRASAAPAPGPASSAPPSVPAAPTAAAVARAVPQPTVVATVKLKSAPNYVAAAPNGHQIYIADGNQTVSVLDTTTNTITTDGVKVPGPARFLSFSPDGRFAYVSLWDRIGGAVHAVCILDTTDNSVSKPIVVRSRPFTTAVTPDGKFLYVPDHDSRTVSVLDTQSRQVVAEIPVARDAHYVSFSTDGKFAYVANHESNVITVIDTATRKKLVEIPVGTAPHSVEPNPRRPMLINVNWIGKSVSVVDTRTNRERKRVGVGFLPLNVRWSPDGRFAYVVNNGDNTVSVVSADSLTVTATLRTGKSPTAIAILPNGAKGYVSNLRGNSLTVLNLAR